MSTKEKASAGTEARNELCWQYDIAALAQSQVEIELGTLVVSLHDPQMPLTERGRVLERLAEVLLAILTKGVA